MDASFKNARALRFRFSQSLARRRQRLSQAIVRSTIQRLGEQQDAAIAILDVGGMDDGVQQQTQRIDENMPLLALDQLAGIEPVRIDASPPFSALFTLWLSMIAAACRNQHLPANRPVEGSVFCPAVPHQPTILVWDSFGSWLPAKIG